MDKQQDKADARTDEVFHLNVIYLFKIPFLIKRHREIYFPRYPEIDSKILLTRNNSLFTLEFGLMVA